MLGQAGVLGKLPELAMNRHEIARSHQIQHQFHLFHAGVSGDMHRRIHAAIHHVGAAARHVVDHAEDGFFVARNDARAQHHRIALLHRDVLVIIHGHARKRRHGLALSAGNEHHDLIGRGLHHVLGADQDAIRNVEQAERMGDLADGCHTASDNSDFAAELRRKIQHKLNAVDRRTEAGDHQPALARLKMSSMRGCTARSDSV